MEVVHSGAFARYTLGFKMGSFRFVAAAGACGLSPGVFPAASDLVGIYEDVGTVLIVR
jgi:hypothetical protein